MPCGPKDARRSTRRCTHCQKDHAKCDGGRPCSKCARQRLKCEYSASLSSSSANKALKVVRFRPKGSGGGSPKEKNRQAVSISPPLEQAGWKHVTAFFDALKGNDVFLGDAWSFQKIGYLVHSNAAVFDAVVAVGETYALKMYTRPSARVEKLRQTIATEFADSKALGDPTFLLRVTLLGLVELMVDETGMRWSSLIECLQSYFIPLSQYVSPTWKTMDPGLHRMLRLCIIFRVLLYPGGPQTLTLSKNPAPATIPEPQPLLNPDSADEKLEYIVQILEALARLKTRCIRWLDPTHHPANKELDGLSILTAGITLQKSITTTLLLTTTTTSPNLDFFLPMCHWVLIGTSYMFQHPLWSQYDWELPVMQGPFVQDQAVLALKGIEVMIEKSPLGSAFYASISPLVSLQIKVREERERVIRLLRGMKSRGFAIAESLEADVRMGWQYPNLRYDSQLPNLQEL